MLSNVNTGFPKVQSVSEHTPWKINIWNPEVVVWKMIFLLFKQVIFRFLVKFPGCTKSEQPIPAMKWLTKLIFPHLLSTPRVLSTGCYPTIIQKPRRAVKYVKYKYMYISFIYIYIHISYESHIYSWISIRKSEFFKGIFGGWIPWSFSPPFEVFPTGGNGRYYLPRICILDR